MHFSTALIAAMGLIGQSQACLSVHWYSKSSAAGTSCIMQLWDKPEGQEERLVWEREHCDAPFFMDNEDYVCHEDDTYKACVTENGQGGHVWNKAENYDKRLVMINHDIGEACCGFGSDGMCKVRCSEFESCLNDGWACDSCELCDFRATCESHLKLFKRELPQSPAQKRSDQAAKIAKREEAARREQEEYIAVHGQEEWDAKLEKLRREPLPGMYAVN